MFRYFSDSDSEYDHESDEGIAKPNIKPTKRVYKANGHISFSPPNVSLNQQVPTQQTPSAVPPPPPIVARRKLPKQMINSVKKPVQAVNDRMGNFPGKGAQIIRQFNPIDQVSDDDSEDEDNDQVKPTKPASPKSKNLLPTTVETVSKPKTQSKTSQILPVEKTTVKSIIKTKQKNSPKKMLKPKVTIDSKQAKKTESKISKNLKRKAQTPPKEKFIKKKQKENETTASKIPPPPPEEEKELVFGNLTAPREYEIDELNSVTKLMHDILHVVQKIPKLKSWKITANKSEEDVINKLVVYLLEIGQFIENLKVEKDLKHKQTLCWEYAGRTLFRTGTSLKQLYLEVKDTVLE